MSTIFFKCLLSNYEDRHFNISLDFFYKPALNFTEVHWNNVLRHMQSLVFYDIASLTFACILKFFLN